MVGAVDKASAPSTASTASTIGWWWWWAWWRKGVGIEIGRRDGDRLNRHECSSRETRRAAPRKHGLRMSQGPIKARFFKHDRVLPPNALVVVGHPVLGVVDWDPVDVHTDVAEGRAG